MGGFLFWLAIVLCVIALVILFFPFRFKVEFEAGEHGCRALFFFFGKRLWTGEKQWGKKKESGEGEARGDYLDGDSSDKDVDDSTSEGAEPEFVATAPVKPVETKAAPVDASTEKTAAPAQDVSAKDVPAEATETKVESEPVAKVEPKASEPPVKETDAKVEPVAPKSAPAKTETPVQDAPEPAPEPEPEKKEKPKLTDEHFWTIILTPDLDARAFRYVKHLLAVIVKLFNIKFVDCFVEGIRADYATMGYGAALNGILKSFPYLQAWDFRMDWCRDRELRAQGEIHARTNLCRFFFLLLVTLVYAAVLFLLFWRRRARVLKTGELPELGFIRKKIVGWMVEE